MRALRSGPAALPRPGLVLGVGGPLWTVAPVALFLVLGHLDFVERRGIGLGG